MLQKKKKRDLWVLHKTKRAVKKFFKSIDNFIFVCYNHYNKKIERAFPSLNIGVNDASFWSESIVSFFFLQ